MNLTMKCWEKTPPLLRRQYKVNRFLLRYHKVKHCPRGHERRRYHHILAHLQRFAGYRVSKPSCRRRSSLTHPTRDAIPCPSPYLPP
ncbi:uncharacterized protein A1O9_06840 [Exophiala aquamarina CBS 119918]|uniref:Uncharacterized protein n=1 Tax=Exophiala aquamarina CBS 119918 TaxID=1182545 RepID=A0A072P9V1_9EURO|nr:uncharacterized protein A1O9_06840 [Exophiala aquamarina CBS 119918]KEF56651.1 hypothetical protein A1O9_06840 [Exophiala aquamarina CBS 119918]